MSSTKKLYQVEKILDKKIIDNTVKYKILWVDFPESECTWEPVENLKKVNYMVEEFEKNFSKKPNRRKRKNSDESLKKLAANSEYNTDADKEDENSDSKKSTSELSVKKKTSIVTRK